MSAENRDTESSVSVPLASAAEENKRDACSTSRAERLAELFKSATELDREQWAAFLEQNADAEMRRDLEALLREHEQASDFLETPALHLSARSFTEAGRRAGEITGNYEVLSLIGSGGMGDVYLALDLELQRKVALKIIRRGMDSDDIIRRFKHEERLLAGLSHSNIAQLYGGGVTADGVPFFAMEYIDGKRIDNYCRDKKLPLNARLELFRKVCAAVHYAHQHLVIHRDIKPSNILVTAEGEPKLLDFGIGKLLDPDQSPALQTLTILNILTPEYASPEHMRGDAVTTASDVYSLGVLLYELLTEQRPYRITTRRPDEIARLICETDPIKPSTALRNRASSIEDRDSADSRFTIHHSRLIKGDLDNIVLRAMRKEPQRRYASVAQFSEDIRRHLGGLPVIARKDTFGYRSGKFIRRHRVAVAAGTVIVLAVIAGLIGIIWQARIAERERAKAEAVNKFLQTTLLSSSPESVVRRHKNDATLKDVLDDIARRLASGELSDQPGVTAELQRIIGAAYLGMGLDDLAKKNLSAALETQSRLYGADHLETLKTRADLATVWVDNGNSAAAEDFYRRYLRIIREETRKGRLESGFLINALYSAALLRRYDGDPRNAETLLREVVSLLPQASPERKEDTEKFNAVLALALQDQGKFDEAEQMFSPKLEALRLAQGDTMVNGPGLSASLSILGSILLGKGEYIKAETNLREAETIYRKVYDATNTQLGDNLRLTADCLYHLGHYAEAETKIDECLKIYQQRLTPQYINFATALMVQGLIYSQTNRTVEAEKLLREAMRIRTQYLPETHFMRAVACGELGNFLATQKRFDEAEPLLLQCYEALKHSQTPDSPRTHLARQRLVALYENSGHADKAEPYRNEAQANSIN
ncbi:MAG: tetratricopeptide repeat protein [Verrucomicrobiota bacterium]